VGAITVRNAYPVTIGANLGTTLTAQLAALATGQPEALVIALVHLMFNVTAVAIIYPVPRIRYLPLQLAERLGRMAAKRRWVMPTYVGSVFVALPVAGVALG
jgi:sodium-dependent phosphate cotransporter